MIGIVVADLNEFTNIETQKMNKVNYNCFTFYHNDKYVFVNSGIGIAQAAAATQALIDKYNPRKIINFGAVGASKKHKINEIIIPEKIYYYDVITPWYDFGQVPHQPKFFTNSFENTKYNLGTGMQFLVNEKQISKIAEKIDVTVFDMECAAIAQITHNHKIPFYVIKIVSDIIGNNDLSLEKTNSQIEKTSQILYKKTMQLIKNI